jgi:hypothetical protein
MALLKIEERPVDLALSSTNGVSNLPENTQPERENGKSLRRILEIFPFFGDARWRLARSALRGVGRSTIRLKATEISSQKSADACLRSEAKQKWRGQVTMSEIDPGCVKRARAENAEKADVHVSFLNSRLGGAKFA